MLISKSLPKFWLKNVEEIGLSCHIVTKINTQQQSPGSPYSSQPPSPHHLVNTSDLSRPGKLIQDVDLRLHYILTTTKCQLIQTV